MVNPIVRRSSKVGLVLSLTLVFGLFLGVLPASAQAVATASVNIHNVLAGQVGKPFTINVVNAEPMTLPGDLGGRTINEVRIVPPTGRITAVGGSAEGWNEVHLLGTNPTEILFRGGTIAPGDDFDFTVLTDVTDQRAADSSDTWLVRVSSNFMNTSAATGAGNALTTVVRQLQVQNVAVVSPAGAADDRDGDGNPEVTGTQSNVCVRSRVFNASAFTLNVTPSVSASGVTFGPARPAGGAGCSGAPLSGGSASIPGKASADFDFLAEFGNVGSKTNRNLVGTASAPGACTPTTSGSCTPTTSGPDDTFVANRIVAVEPKADISYVGDTLEPRVVVPGSLDKVFTLSINKGPNGSPPLGTFAGTFSSAFGNTTVASPTSIDGGQLLNQNVEFAAMDIADIDDDRYPVDVKFQYTDGNGLIQPLTTPSGPSIENVRLDSLIPDVTIDLTPPDPQVDAEPPVAPAVTDGEPFDVDGTVTDTDPDTDMDAPCGPAPATMRCSLTSVELIQFPLPASQGGGTPVGDPIDITDQCSLSALGQISCPDVAVDFADGVQSTQVTAEVNDEAELPGEDQDELVDVDNIVPILCDTDTDPALCDGRVARATRGPVAGQRRAVNVPFNEAAQAGPQNQNQAIDWRAQDGEEKGVAAVSQPADKKSVNLTTILDLHADVPNGTVEYAATPLSTRYNDRVGLLMEDDGVTLTDGIAPLAPTIETVNGNVAQEDDKFYFNTPSVEIHLNNDNGSADDPAIADGYDVEVYKEANGEDGLQRTGDDQLCADTAAGDSITLTCDFGAVEGEADVYAISIDPSGNVGDLSLVQLVLDMTRPIFQSATIAGDSITVTFSEDLRTGSNVSNHWLFNTIRNSDGESKSFNIGSVTGTGQVRVLEIESPEYNASDFTAHSVRYVFFTTPGQSRYADRASNELLDIPNGPIG